MVKDIAGIIKKFNNIELNQKILDLGSQALAQQDELAKLKAENRELKEQKNISDKIERHSTLYLTLKDDPLKISYCSNCWDSEQKLIQIELRHNNEHFYCPHCKHIGYYNNSISYLNTNLDNYDYDPYKKL